MTNKKNTSEISLKNTKEQILAAYQNAMSQVEAKPFDLVLEKQKESALTIVNKATQSNPDNIVSELSMLKGNLMKKVDSLSECMMSESKKLEELRQAINIEKSHLNELYEINETAKTLAALILAQQQQKENFVHEMQEEKSSFEREMTEKKASWKQQQEILTTEYKELKENLEKSRKREEEEYKYNLALSRKKEADAYAAEKAVWEKELVDAKQALHEREESIRAKEVEFNELKQKVDNFPLELKKIQEDTEKATKLRLEANFKFASELRDKEIEGENRLNAHKIETLNKKITEQAQLIEQLTKKADDSVKQTQQIACRALDTSGQRFSHPYFQDDKSSKLNEKA